MSVTIFAVFSNGGLSQIEPEFVAPFWNGPFIQVEPLIGYSDDDEDPESINIADPAIIASAYQGSLAAGLYLQKRMGLLIGKRLHLFFKLKNINIDKAPTGLSAGLAFALSFATDNHVSNIEWISCKICTTGVIGAAIDTGDSPVQRVDHINEKIRGAVENLGQYRAGEEEIPLFIFYPQSNEEELEPEIKDAAEEKGINLYPVSRLSEAIETLLKPHDEIWKKVLLILIIVAIADDVKKRRRKKVLIGILIIAAVAVVIFIIFYRKPPDQPHTIIVDGKFLEWRDESIRSFRDQINEAENINADLHEIKVCNDSENIYFYLSVCGRFDYRHIFYHIFFIIGEPGFNYDGNMNNNYRYLLETCKNNNLMLYRYSGERGEWAWSRIGIVNFAYSQSEREIEIKVPLALVTDSPEKISSFTFLVHSSSGSDYHDLDFSPQEWRQMGYTYQLATQ